ncbi:MAG TPA: hypothetical protein VH877_13410 [Polyangia bacterium]|nr:hypothetical protein [Polyangia bacterium]
MHRDRIKSTVLSLSLTLLALAACDRPRTWENRVALPEPLTNNAVAAVAGPAGCTLYSAFGLDATRQRPGIHGRAFAWREGQAAWQALPDAPGLPRIATSGVALRGKFWVLGGYSIDVDDNETSHTELVVYDPASNAWSSVSPLPVAIDDAMAVAWRDRYIVVVSGWSNTRPVPNVQIYDADSDTWSAGTDFPGTAVFGGAAGLDGDDLYVIDGVGLDTVQREFVIVNQTWRARLDPNNPTTIQWTSLGPHPGPARYRAAAGPAFGRVLFVGGTDNPYNYDGLSYDNNQPSAPLASLFGIDPRTGTFGALETRPQATMDHRALVGCGDAVYTVGGMTTGPNVVNWVLRLQ